jgi:hypothetical protein
MKQIFLILTSITIFGCSVNYEGGNLEKEFTNYEIPTYSNTKLILLQIDSCEYLFAKYHRSAFLTHKGNCKNKIHQYNIENK